MAKSKKRDYKRLCEAIRADRKTLEWHRRCYSRAVKECAGPTYAEHSDVAETPVNLLDLFVQTYTRSLVPKSPRVLLSTFDGARKPDVRTAQDWTNRRLEEMRLDLTLRRVVQDALMLVGVARVNLADPFDADQSAWGVRAGTPMVKRVSPDNVVYDTHCGVFEEAAYQGERLRVPFEAARENPRFNKAARKKLRPQEDRQYNEGGDERASYAGRDTYADDAEYRDYCDVWQIYLPHERRICWLASDDGGTPDGTESSILDDAEWVGPDTGPYHWLGLGPVADNAMPSAPVQKLVYPHRSFNNILWKLIRQASHQKTIGVTEGGADDDGKRVVDAMDGDMIRLNRPESTKELAFGGPNPQLFAMLQPLQQYINQLMGNLELLAGLAAQSKTASQDKMLNENSSRTMTDMQESVIAFVSRIMRSFLWYVWNDPFTVMEEAFSPPGVREVSSVRRLYPNRQEHRVAGRRVRSGAPPDLKIDPYSMQFSTPQSRAAALTAIWTQEIMPALGLAQQQGVYADFSRYLELKGKYADIPELQEIVTIQQPPEALAGAEGGAAQDGAGMPKSTSREYVRRNVPQEGGMMDEAQQMMEAATAE